MKQLVNVVEYDVTTKQMVEKEVEMEMVDPLEVEKQWRVQEIKQRLSEIDTEFIRPLRATVDGSASEFDTQKLTALEAEAKLLREELNEKATR